ncbi:MAG: methyltransferase, partial [Paracoccaceae bacterium]
GLLFLLIPWTMHSVLKYFTINRALGGDHFDDKYLNMPMVNEGAFKYSNNAMYTFVFSGMWGIGLMLGSWNAIILALFYHAYIWVHMYCTEDPDMRILYKS